MRTCFFLRWLLAYLSLSAASGCSHVSVCLIAVSRQSHLAVAMQGLLICLNLTVASGYLPDAISLLPAFAFVSQFDRYQRLLACFRLAVASGSLLVILTVASICLIVSV